MQLPRRAKEIHSSVTEDRVLAMCMRRMRTLDNPGICIACGAEADGCEPDAARYTCEACDEKQVYGSDELLIRGYYHPDPNPPKEAA